MISFTNIVEKEPKAPPSKGNHKKIDVRLREISIFDKDAAAEESPKVTDTANGKAAYCKLLFKLADKVRDWVKSDQAINTSAITRVMGDIVEKDLIENVYHYLTFNVEETQALPSRSVKTTLLSLKIGVGMGYDNERLADLGTAAFLYDLGKYKMPEDVLNKRGTLSEQEFQEIQRHPQISADILSGLDDNYGWLPTVVLQVHERADGSGYPFGLKQEEIHEYAFIIGLADLYADMISNGRGGQGIEPHAAIREILATAQQEFPTIVVKNFVNQVSFFPLGSHVKLNDRSIGRVVNTNPDYPLRPTVEVLNDGIGSKVPNTRVVDLSQQVLLYITGSVDETENP
jgi:HD-GYP domain-containing protein (c-di-GMP phosphodiesterase class II)